MELKDQLVREAALDVIRPKMNDSIRIVAIIDPNHRMIWWQFEWRESLSLSLVYENRPYGDWVVGTSLSLSFRCKKLKHHTTHNSKTTPHQRMNFIGWTQKLEGTSGRRGAFFTDVCAKLVEIWDLYMLHGVPLNTMWDQSICILLHGPISHFTTFVPWAVAFRRRKSKEVVGLFEECFFSLNLVLQWINQSRHG